MIVNSSDRNKAIAAVEIVSNLGWPIIPCWWTEGTQCGCGKADCDSPGKHPIADLVPHGSKDASADPKVLEKWWERYPQANVAAATGEHLWALDLDGDEGIRAFAQIVGSHPKLPETSRARTGGGGRHLFFAPDPAVRNATKLRGHPIDVRGQGGYVLLPPSDHISGNAYTWERPAGEHGLQPAPSWLIDFVTARKGRSANGGESGPVLTFKGDLDTHPGVAEGERNSTLCQLVGVHLAADGATEDLMALAIAWGEKCDPPYPEGEVRKTVEALEKKHVDETSRIAGKTKVSSTFIPWRSFPVQILPEPIRSFVNAGARAIGCDPSYIALPLLSALASVVGATRRIQLKPGWTEPCIVWTAVIGESGTAKSPAMSFALRALRHLQAKRFQEHEQVLEHYERDKITYEAALAEWKKKGRNQGHSLPEKPEPPVVARLLVNDITIEALADRLQGTPRGLLAACDELSSWIGSFDAYRAGRGSDVSRWLSIHRAESLIVDRKSGPTKTVYIARPAVSITGGIQPRPLRRSLGVEHVDNGLLARLLLALPPSRGKKWRDAAVDPELLQQMETVLGRLLALDFGTDDSDSPAPIDLLLTGPAQQRWIEFYNQHAEEGEQLTGALASAWSKLEGYAARLSLIVHLVRDAAGDPTLTSPDEVDEQSVDAGVALARWFGYEAERVYSVLNETEQDRDRRQLIELIVRKGRSITARDLRRNMRRFTDSADEAEQALNDLVVAGFGAWQPIGSTPDGGRPTRVFRLSESCFVDETPVFPGESVGFVDTNSGGYDF